MQNFTRPTINIPLIYLFLVQAVQRCMGHHGSGILNELFIALVGIVDVPPVLIEGWGRVLNRNLGFTILPAIDRSYEVLKQKMDHLPVAFRCIGWNCWHVSCFDWRLGKSSILPATDRSSGALKQRMDHPPVENAHTNMMVDMFFTCKRSQGPVSRQVDILPKILKECHES